ncbi:MAG: hypothetical protein E4G99_10410 [Anaerolineales bacterium]|nr:MAG: hypothetical protein E4G99_10410 [Anaerolineales bacterium]
MGRTADENGQGKTSANGMKNTTIVESAESASPVITRLVAGVLNAKHEPVFKFAAWERLGMRVLNRLPAQVARSVVRWQFGRSAISPQRARLLNVEHLVHQRLQDYHALEGQFPVVVLGSALAGATAHIASILGGPYLPQPFILGLRGGSPDESVEPHLALTSMVAEEILKRNSNVKAIAHFDPIHDGWLTRSVSHLRLKLIDLPPAYGEFLRGILTPGGTILYLDCRAQWLQFPISKRFVYQVGGWGGIPAQEFISGSERIDRALKAAGSTHRGGWSVPGIEPGWSPESEWGSEPGLDQALQSFAEEHGYRFQRVQFDHPHDFSRLALEAHKRLYTKQDREIAGVLVEIFTQYDPFTVLQAGLLPLWLVFNTSDSLEFMQDMLGQISPALPVFFSGLATLSRTPDMVPWDVWASAFEGRPWLNIGAGPRRYPEDLVALFRWGERLREGLDLTRMMPPARLSLEEFSKLIPDIASIST